MSGSFTIGYAYVCGDILHQGHLLHLKNAKALCDKLVVGVLTDEAIMEKKQKPIVPFEERIRLVGELECVDVVVAQDTYSPKKNVNDIRPDVLLESSSHDNPYIYNYNNSKTVILPYFPVQSSTAIKKKVKTVWKGGDKNDKS